MSCTTQMFGNGIKIYVVISTLNDSLLLQNDLDILALWSNDWLHRFNVAKCKVLSIGRSLPTSYHVGESDDLSFAAEEKDLGVWITENLDVSLQCTKVANKAMQAIGLIKQTFRHINVISFLKLCKCYIRSHLEYCTQVWSSYKAKDIDILEKVQCHATKLVPELANRAGRYWSFASRYIVQKYITILLFIAVIKDDCYIRVADCFIRVSRS